MDSSMGKGGKGGGKSGGHTGVGTGEGKVGGRRLVFRRRRAVGRPGMRAHHVQPACIFTARLRGKCARAQSVPSQRRLEVRGREARGSIRHLVRRRRSHAP